MSPTPSSAPALSLSLGRLHAAGHPAGLPPERAQALAAALDGGTPFGEAALHAGLDPTLTRIVARSQAPDPVGAVEGLLRPLGLATAWTGVLKGAGLYPFAVLAFIAASAGITFGWSVPTLSTLDLDASPAGSLTWCYGTVSALLLLLGSAVAWRLHLPLLGRSWQRIEGYLFLEALRVLAAGGVPLPLAARAASEGRPPPIRTSGEGLAALLESNQQPAQGDLEPLLDSTEAGFLLSATRSGAFLASCDSLVQLRERSLEREVLAEASRIHVLSLLLGGLALLPVGIAYFAAYGRVIGG